MFSPPRRGLAATPKAICMVQSLSCLPKAWCLKIFEDAGNMLKIDEQSHDVHYFSVDLRSLYLRQAAQGWKWNSENGTWTEPKVTLASDRICSPCQRSSENKNAVKPSITSNCDTCCLKSYS